VAKPSVLCACSAPLIPYSADTPPLVLAPTSLAGVQDKRARFREIYCAVLEARGRELPQHDAQAVGTPERLVAVRRDEQARHCLDPSSEHAENIERRLVGPVQVIEHEQGDSVGPHLGEQCARDLVRHRTIVDERLQSATHLLGDPEQWAERGRREQRLTLAPDDPRFGACGGQGLDERSLADAGLAAEQDHAAGGTVLDRVDTVAESCELAPPLE